MNIFTIFSKKPKEIGDEMTLCSRDGTFIKGKVIEKCENDPKYHNHAVVDMKTENNTRYVNSGKDYYKVKVD